MLDRTVAGRTFRRVQGTTLSALLAAPVDSAADGEPPLVPPAEPGGAREPMDGPGGEPSGEAPEPPSD